MQVNTVQENETQLLEKVQRNGSVPLVIKGTLFVVDKNLPCLAEIQIPHHAYDSAVSLGGVCREILVRRLAFTGRFGTVPSVIVVGASRSNPKRGASIG